MQSFAFTVYTDGAHSPVAMMASWAYMILKGTEEISVCSGIEALDGSSAAEVMAVVRALQALPDGSCVRVYTDHSSLLGFAAMDDQKFRLWQSCKGIHAPDLSRMLCELRNQVAVRTVTFKWIRSRSHEFNRRCDKLCSQALRAHSRVSSGVGGKNLVKKAEWHVRAQNHLQRNLHLVQVRLKELRQRPTENPQANGEVGNYAVSAESLAKAKRLVEKWRHKALTAEAGKRLGSVDALGGK